MYGKWENKLNCNDPRQLFESIVLKPENVVKSIGFIFWSYPIEMEPRIVYKGLREYSDWHHYDSMMYGRCFTMNPPKKLTKYGIKKVFLKLKVNATIFIHTPGMRLKTKGGELMQLHNVALGKKYNFAIKHESYEVLDYGGDPCNNEQNYSKDLCADVAIQTESINKIGCTTPFGPDKNQICRERNESRAARSIYHHGFNNMRNPTYAGCINPCSFFSITTTGANVNDHDALDNCRADFNFREIIKESKGYLIYSKLSLIAEVGGYVGLFLGFSINHITNLIEFLVMKIEQLYLGD